MLRYARNISSFASKAFEKYVPGSALNGYTIQRTRKYDSLDMAAIELRHNKTGAQHVHIIKDDPNNLFCCAFATPPSDNTGVPHILEHTALCGSKRFPVRDPFFKMLNRSMATFMNAMTGNDYTMYPFSTENEKDYYNLMDVYTDAVFHPQLSEMDFKQEGWRLEHDNPLDPSTPLVFKGVVYNEMKGALSDSGNLFCTRLQQEMFPGTTYAVVSGGDPPFITDLTHEQLVAFHRKFYHPSNAKFLTYGNFGLDKQLKYLDNILSKFEKSDTATVDVALQRFVAPKTIKTTCPPDPGNPMISLMEAGQLNRQTKMSISYLTDVGKDPVESMAMGLITSLLISGPSSPMYKALIASNLASEYSASTGFDRSTSFPSVSIGLQGMASEDVPKAEKLIQETLEHVCANGFDQGQIDAIFHQYELNLKHRGSNFGLVIGQYVSSPWIHGLDPLEVLNYPQHLEELKQVMWDKEYIGRMIEKYFIKNNHRLTFIMEPEEEFNARLEEEEGKKLQSTIEKLSKKEKEQIEKDGRNLLDLQNEKQDLNCLPALSLEDIPRVSRPFPVEVQKTNGLSIQCRVTQTNGISYTRIAKSIKHLPDELQPYVPVFCQALASLGTKNRSVEELDELIKSNSGGINASAFTSAEMDNLLMSRDYIHFSSYFLESQRAERSRIVFDLFEEVLRSADWRNMKRLYTVVSSMAMNGMSSLAGSGHHYAMSASSRHFSPSLLKMDTWEGVGSVQFLNKIAPASPSDTSHVADMLEQIASLLLSSDSDAKCAINATEDGVKESKDALQKFAGNLMWSSDPSSPARDTSVEFKTRHYQEVYPLPFSVNYTARSFLAVPYTHPDSVPLQILASLLTSQFLHREIREKGGAYGGGARYESIGGCLSLWSYRDPSNSLPRTLDTYSKAAEWASSITKHVSERELNEAKLAIFKAIDAPISPSQEGMAFFKYGVSDALRQKRRDQFFKTSLSEIEEVAKRYLLKSRFSTAILGDENVVRKIASCGGWKVMEMSAQT